MKKLEQTLEKTSIKLKNEDIKPVIRDKIIYYGLRLVEEKTYQGPTGVKYWM